jgi:molybdenum cofactor cytidylyltransferase
MIPAIVLAAGKSTRMGRPKALLPIGPSGNTFLTQILSALRDGGIQHTVVVLGGHADAIRASLRIDDRFVKVLENKDFEQGQLSSLLVGIAGAEDLGPDVEAVMMTLVDLPLVSAATVRAVLDAYRRSPTAPIVRPRRDGRHGHPVVFNRSLFSELRGADPSKGARPIVQAHAAEEQHVDIADEGAFTDIDTPEDYATFIVPTLRAGD